MLLLPVDSGGDTVSPGYVVGSLHTGTTVDWKSVKGLAAPSNDVTQDAYAGDGTLLVVGQSEGGSGLTAGGMVLAAVDPATGKPRWTKPMPTQDSNSGPQIAFGKSAVSLTTGKATTVFDPSDGKQKSTLQLNGDLASLQPLVTTNGSTTPFLKPDGSVSSTVKSDDSSDTNTVTMSGGNVILSSDNPISGYPKYKAGTVSAMTPTGTPVWSSKSDSADIVGANGRFVVVSVQSTNSVVALDASNGKPAVTIPLTGDLADCDPSNGADVVDGDKLMLQCQGDNGTNSHVLVMQL